MQVRWMETLDGQLKSIEKWIAQSEKKLNNAIGNEHLIRNASDSWSSASCFK